MKGNYIPKLKLIRKRNQARDKIKKKKLPSNQNYQLKLPNQLLINN